MRVVLAVLLLLGTVFGQSERLNPQVGEGRIVGTVMNDDGEPIAEAMLCVITTHSHGSSSTCGGDQSDKDGRFEIKHAPFGDVQVSAEATLAGYWTEQQPKQLVHLTPAAPVGHINVKIGPRPGVLSILVADKETGKPIDFDLIVVSWMLEDLSKNLTSHSRHFGREGGRLQVPIKSNADVLLEVQAEGYRRAFYIDPATMQPLLRVQPGEQRQLDVALEPEGR